MDEQLALLGRIAGGVAHDLNNFLAVIDMSLAMATRSPTEARLQHEITYARTAVEAAIRLNKTVLDYARGGRPERERVDLVALVRRVVKIFGRLVPTAVTVKLEIDEAPPPVSALVCDLEQVVLNLMLNACDAMPEGGELTLAVRAIDGTRVAIEVTDTGVGIADDQRAGDGPRSRSGKRQSAGLGLGIVRAAATRHGASITMATRRGGGTVASFVLPASVPGAP